MNREDRILRYYGLVDVIVDKLLTIRYYRQFKYMREDLHGEGVLGLIHAIDTYDPERGVKEVTYVSLKVRGYIIDHIRKHKRYESPLLDIDDSTFENLTIEESKVYVEEDYEIIDKYEPDDKINKEIYNRCLLGSTTCQTIADEFGISRDSVQKRKRRLIKRLRKLMENTI